MAEGKTALGILTAFAVGYLMAAQDGKERVSEVVTAARAVVASSEFGDLRSAVRSHAGAMLQDFGRSISGDGGVPPSIVTLLDRARDRIKDAPTEP